MRLRGLFCLFMATYSLGQQQIIEQNSGVTENLRGVSAVSAAVAWASGTHGTYLRTIDGGNTWDAEQIQGPESLDFRDVKAFSAEEAYLLSAGPGEKSRIYKTTDGGKNWTLQFLNQEPKGFFDCMAFWDREHGIALGDPVHGKFELITTNDGGQHWNLIPADHLPPAVEGEAAFAASGTCIAVQDKGNVWFGTGGKVARVFRSTDGGKSWQVSDTPIVHGSDSQGIFSIAFRDHKHGIIAGGDYKQPDQGGRNLAFSTDGGATWRLAELSPQSYFSVIAFDPKNGDGLWAAGIQGTYSGDTQQKTWTKTWPFKLNGLSLDPTGNAVGVGPNGSIIRFRRPTLSRGK